MLPITTRDMPGTSAKTVCDVSL